MDKKNCLLYLHVQPETGVHISDLSHRRTFTVKDVLEYVKSQVGKGFDPQELKKFIVMIKARWWLYFIKRVDSRLAGKTG